MRETPDPGCENDNVPPTPAQQARAARLAAQIAELAQAGFILPGTLTERMTRCGYPRCRCHADPPQLHGPYHQWTRKINGKTVTRILTDDQLADYQPWFDNQRRLRALITELETLSQEIADKDPRQNRQAAKTNVGTARLTCGQPASPTPSGQVSPKREVLSMRSSRFSRVRVHVRAWAPPRDCPGLGPGQTCRAFPRKRPAQLRTGSLARGLAALNLWAGPKHGRIRAGQRQT
jgi:hypothetical protein